MALLPFVDESRLLGALRPLYSDLTEEEDQRAVKGSDRLFVSKWHKSYDFLTSMYESGDDEVSGTLLLGILRHVVMGNPMTRWYGEYQ